MCLLVRVSTDLTDMRLNVGVNLHMVGQRTFVREALVTFTALERSLACNRNELKLASEIKGYFCLTRVISHVRVEVVLVAQLLPADRARGFDGGGGHSVLVPLPALVLLGDGA